MKLKLPDVTLVMIETREHALASMAVADCLAKVIFGDVLILTNKSNSFQLNLESALEQSSYESQSLRYHLVSDWPDKLGWCRAAWFEVPPLLRTSHALFIQWDSWVWDPAMWRNEFLQYDYIGAPWWYTDNMNVGNSGFSLKSTRLAKFVRKHSDRYQLDVTVEDDQLCRKYRPDLEQYGFCWAPEWLAYDFSYEGCGPNPKPPTKHFGFHAAFNFKHVLSPERLRERAELMMQSPYLQGSYIMKAFCENNPELVRELLKAGGHDIGTLTQKEIAHG